MTLHTVHLVLLSSGTMQHVFNCTRIIADSIQYIRVVYDEDDFIDDEDGETIDFGSGNPVTA